MTYTGPGDLQTFAGWWGLRAYSGATAGNPCAVVAATRGGATTIINTLANGNFDSVSANTAMGGNTGFVSQLYDQTGNGFHLTQSTSGNWPAITLNVLQGGTLPILLMPNVIFSTNYGFANATFTAGSAGYSCYSVGKLISWTTGSGNGPWMIDNNGHGFAIPADAQMALWYTGFSPAGGAPITFTDNVYHRVFMVDNGASPNSFYSLDGTQTTFTGDTTSTWGAGGAGLNLGGNGNTSLDMLELGVSASTFNSSQVTALDSNANSYWLVAAAAASPFANSMTLMMM